MRGHRTSTTNEGTPPSAFPLFMVMAPLFYLCVVLLVLLSAAIVK